MRLRRISNGRRRFFRTKLNRCILLLYRFSYAMLIQQRLSDSSEESDETKTTNLRSSYESNAPLESLECSGFRGIQGPSADLECDVTHRERPSVENFRLDKREHLSVQSKKNPILLSTRKLQRIDRKQLLTYGNHNPPEHPQLVRSTRTPWRLAVDELDLIPDRFPSTPIQHSIGRFVCIS